MKEDTPESFIQAITCLTQQNYLLTTKPELIYPDHGNIWNRFYDQHFLASNPEHDIISNFRRIHRTTIPTENNRKVYRYRLQYCGSWIHDDFWASHHIPFVYWLATIAYDSYIGYCIETNGSEAEMIHFKVNDGKLVEPNNG